MENIISLKKDKVKSFTFIFLALISIMAVAVRVKFLPFVSKDMVNFLIPWFNTIKDNGGFAALSQPIGNYTPPYYYILAFISYFTSEPNVPIKVVSCVFDFITAIYIFKTVFYITKDIRRSAVSYALALFLPTVIINGSAWGQCDGIFTSFVVMSIYYMLVRKEYIALTLFGIAFAFKLQAIFIAPFIIIMIIKGWISPKKLYVIPIAYLAMMLPAITLGDNILRIINIYLGQTGEYGDLSLNMANMWAFMKNVSNESVSAAATFFALSAVLILMYYMLVKDYKLNPRIIVTGMAFFALFIPYILPHMHERYYYTGVVLTVPAVIGSKKNIPILFITELVSVMSMSAFVFDNEIESWALLAFIFAIALVAFFKLFDGLISENISKK